jgi:hypothetical protein
MSTRAANATIKGYYYQFDTSILKALELIADGDSITVEGIEDIDINTATENSFVQCKYLSKPKFINSAVREPIMLMLDHYISLTTPNSRKYVLYAHFEDETPGTEKSIDLTTLKAILTYTEKGISKCYHSDKGISDADLTSFLGKFKLLFGEEFESQQKKVITKLKSTFGCSEFEADTYLYNNALRVILDKAIKENSSHRVITKTEFITSVDCRKKLFCDWYIQLRSKDEYLKRLKDNLKSTKALLPSRSKYILIGNDIVNCEHAELPLLSFIENLINEYYQMNRALRNAKPLTVIIDCDNSLLIQLKKDLSVNGIRFNDGLEPIAFNPHIFNEEPIINCNKAGKITKSSYLLKIISKHSLISNLSLINNPKVVLHFSKEDCPYIRSSTYQWFDIKYCKNLKEVFKLLK